MHQVDVELVGLAAGPAVDGARSGLAYTSTRTGLMAATTPDEAAGALCPTGVEVLHSTSWRREASGVLVLTYVAAPVPVGPGAVPLVEPSIVCSGDPLGPTPSDVHAHHVAAHAVRHLAYLLTRDPGVAAAAAASRDRDLWELVLACAELPTGTHREAHARAHLATADTQADARADGAAGVVLGRPGDSALR